MRSMPARRGLPARRSSLPVRSSVIGFLALGIVLIGTFGFYALKAYNKQVDHCKSIGGHVVSVTTYGTAYVSGGYVNGKYVSGGSISTSNTTTTCNDPHGVVLFGM